MKSINIIGAGLSGLILGNYLIDKGYKVDIYEMKNRVGGSLLPFSQRKINEINLCKYFIKNNNDIWNELKIKNIKFKKIKYIKSIKFSNNQISIPSERNDLEKFFIQLSPYKEDYQAIKLLLDDVKFIEMKSNVVKTKKIKSVIENIKLNKKIKKYKKLEVEEFLDSLKDKNLKETIKCFVNKKASMLYFIDLLLELYNGELVIVEGGNLALMDSLKEKFISQGGIIHLNSKVKKIEIINSNIKKRILLENGEKKQSDIIISSIDGFYTMIHLLEEKNINKDIDKLFLNAELFDSYVIINLIVKKELKCNNISNRYILSKPFIDVSGAFHRKLDTLTVSDSKKTIISVYIRGNYDYWKKSFESEFNNYELNKVLISRKVILELQKEISGLENIIEKVDIVTPYEYCKENNIWRGVERGWIPTPKFYKEEIKINAIDDIYFCGNLLNVGATIMGDIKKSREIAKNICLKDNIKFK